jgi:hypothetical protein
VTAVLGMTIGIHASRLPLDERSKVAGV